MLSNKIVPDQSSVGNENRAHVHKAGRYNLMADMPAEGGTHRPPSPGEITAPGLCSPTGQMRGPHDGGRRVADNASAPTRQATYFGNESPGYTGVSPRVAAELYKAPPAFADRIRDHANRKK